MRNLRVKLALSLISLLGIIGVWVLMSNVVDKETKQTVSISQADELAEAKRLNQKVEKPYRECTYSEAIPLTQSGLGIPQKIYYKHPQLLVNLNDLTELYQNQGKLNGTEATYKQALQTAKQVFGRDSIFVAIALNNLAGFYQSEGRLSEAEPLYQEALQMAKRKFPNGHSFVILALNNLAGIYQSQGRLTEAEPLYQEALNMTKRLFKGDDLFLVVALNNLALLYQIQGRLNDAEPLYEEALKITKGLFPGDNPLVALSMNNLAGLYQTQGMLDEKESRQTQEERQKKLSEAECYFQKSFSMSKRLFPSGHPLVVITLNNLGLVNQIQGKLSEAEPLFQEALEMSKRLFKGDNLLVATSLNNLAELYQAQRRLSEAEPLFQQALQMTKGLVGDKHPDVATSLNNLARLYSSQGNMTKAFDFLTQGLEVEENNLAYNLGSGFERQKRDYIKTISATTDGTISLHLNSAPNNPKAAKLALTAILQRKGRILDVLTNNLQILRQRVNDSQSQELINQLSKKYSQLASLIYSPPKNREKYAEKVKSVEREVKQLEDKLSRRSKEFSALSQPPTLEAVQKLIPSDTALVEIFRYKPLNPEALLAKDRFGKPRYVAYVLTSSGEPKAIDLGDAEQINQIIELFRQSLRDPDTSTEQVKLSARDLDKMVMEPIRKLLGNKRKILISPDGALNLIPFEALVDENNRYLVENYSFTYLTSGRDLLRLQNQYPSKQQPVVMGDPSFRKQGQVVAIKPNKPKNTRSIDLSQTTFSPLEGTRKEAESIAQLLGVKPLLGTQASEDVIKQLQSPEILHIATHGFFESPSNTQENQKLRERNPYFYQDNPLLLSGLVLSGYKNRQGGGSEDGILTAQETTGLNLFGTKLVVLSACDTGTGTDSTGEGIYGLRRALVIAGSESQVISLWKVDDNATKDLMVKYFERVLAKNGRTEALRQTQLEMLQGEEYQHPYYWAAFIPSGDGRRMGE